MSVTRAEAAKRLPVSLSAQRRAIFYVCLASALFVVASLIVKAVAPVIPTIEIALFRGGVSCLVLLPTLRAHGGWSALRTNRPFGHVGRTCAGFIGMVGLYYGYGTLPLATVTALSFAMPMCLALLSIPLLGERVGPARMMGVVAGLIGVLIMLRPWSAVMGDQAALPLVPVLVVLVGVLFWAMAMISIRKMGETGERSITIVLYYSFGSALMSGLLVIPVWVTPEPWVLAGLIAVGTISAVAQMVMTAGYRAGETSLVAPFEYGAIIYTTILGAAIWGEVPDVWTWLGIAILVSAGVVVWRRG